MNILILSTHLNTGGISSYIMTLAKGLNRQNHCVFVATSGGDRVEELKKYGAEHIELNIRTKSELNPKIYFSIGKISRFIEEEKIDIIHTNTRITQVMGVLLSKTAKKKHVATCHGFFKTRFFRKIFSCWGDRTIAISKEVKEHLMKDFQIDERKISLIHNGLDLEQFVVPDEVTKEKKRKESQLNKKPVIGIIARLSEVKGHDVLIKAMKKVVEKFPQSILLIIGEGKSKEALLKASQKLNLSEHVLFLPIVNKTAEMLCLFDLFVMPSLQEGLGLSVMEAQAMGLPVVASRVGGIPSLIEDGKTGFLVKPGDSEELAQAIIACLNDPLKAKNVGQNARRFIEQEFSAEQMVRETIQAYEAVLRQ